MKLYGKVLVTVDQMGNQLTRDRVREFCKLTAESVHLCYIATERVIISEMVTPLGEGSDVDVTAQHVQTLQEYVDLLDSEGLKVDGRIISAAESKRGDAIADLAEDIGADLVILNFEYGGPRAKAKIAQQVVARKPNAAVLVARPTR